MKHKVNIYILILVILVIIISILLVLLINKMSIEKQKQNNSVEKEDSIFENEDETGEEKYNVEQLDNFEFEITEMPEDVLNNINDIENFKTKIKEYIYINGLVQANIAKYDNHKMEQGNSKIIIRFILNDISETKLVITMDLKSNEMEITDY